MGAKAAGNSTSASSPVLQRFKTWLAEPQKGTISLQHDVERIPVSNIAPSLSLLKDSSYQFVDVATCAGVKAYDDAVLVKAGLITSTANVIDPYATVPTDNKVVGNRNSSAVDPRDEAFAKWQRGSSVRSTASWFLASFLLLFSWI